MEQTKETVASCAVFAIGSASSFGKVSKYDCHGSMGLHEGRKIGLFRSQLVLGSEIAGSNPGITCVG